MFWGFTRCWFLGYYNYWAGLRADALLDDSHMLQCLDFVLNPVVMLKRQSVRFLTYGAVITCVHMHSDQICVPNVLTTYRKKTCGYFSLSSWNLTLVSSDIFWSFSSHSSFLLPELEKTLHWTQLCFYLLLRSSSWILLIHWPPGICMSCPLLMHMPWWCTYLDKYPYHIPG